MKAAIANGYFFEECVTGKRPQFRETPIAEQYYDRVGRMHDDTVDRFKDHGRWLRETYIHPEATFGNWREVEFPEFILAGESDVEQASKSGFQIIDIKLLSSIHDTLDPDGRLFTKEYALQPVSYGLMYLLEATGKDGVDTLYQAASAFLREDLEAADGLSREWASGISEWPELYFLAAEPVDTDKVFDIDEERYKHGKPLHQFLRVDVETPAWEYMLMLVAYLSIARAVNKMVVAKNIYSSGIHNQLDPNERRCLGKNVQGKHGGRCQFVGTCAYGQTLFNRQTINFQSVWNSD